MKKRRAYTLIELIVVIAILGIVMAISLPNSNLFKSMQESLEVKEFKRDMLYARNRAILDSQDYHIIFDVKKNNYLIDKGVGENRIVLVRKTFIHGTVLSSGDIKTRIIFKANGTIGGSDAIYYNNSLGDEYKVSISPVAYGVSVVKHKSNSK